MLRVKAAKRIYDIGARGTVFYLILKGCVRLFSSAASVKVLDSEYERMNNTLQFDRDLVPGDMFGEEVGRLAIPSPYPYLFSYPLPRSTPCPYLIYTPYLQPSHLDPPPFPYSSCWQVLSGERKRHMAALALSAVELIVIDENVFLKAQEGAGGGLSMDERVAFINKVSIFKGWDQYRLYKVAHSVEQVEFNKGVVILDNEDISPKMYILLSGSIDVFANAHSANPLNSLSRFDYVGESGFLNSCLHTRSNSNKFTETFCLIARTRVLMLTFPESEFHIIDGMT